MAWPKQTAPHKDDEATADARDVVDAALALQVGEFDLFRLAYRRWHGEEAEEKALERLFAGYMFHQRVPPWVRQYCRAVLQSQAEGRLHRAAFGAETVRRRVPAEILPRRFIGVTMVVMFLAYILFVLLG